MHSGGVCVCVSVCLDKMESTVNSRHQKGMLMLFSVCVCVRLFQAEMTEKAYTVNNIIAARSTNCRRFE